MLQFKSLAIHVLLVVCIANTPKKCSGSILSKHSIQKDSEGVCHMIVLQSEKSRFMWFALPLMADPSGISGMESHLDRGKQLVPCPINTRRTSKFDPRNILHWNPEENIGNISLKSYVNATPDLFSYLPDQRVIDGLMEFLKPHEPQIDIRNDLEKD
ncbi:hypothetical protein PGTUg99_008311 [Puccinia graminis f. sp. tritici]|uniref:Uncharacterized protein n=1 Tax=Puccinia graminis f. sp. tritici TaxID=56615 RepID=A0A5B0NSL1_PUCGR|nr:hypothetical protein PGTUg99_008311 [Puccinia graminis f. sp. tritici]